MASPGSILLAFFILMAVPAHGHNMGRLVPIGYAGEGSASLAAQVVAAYFEEQMGREIRLVKSGSPAQCIQSVRNREFPMAVVPESAVRNLPEGLLKLEGALGLTGRTFVVVMGSEASKKLEFSLLQRYLDALSEGLDPADWERAELRVEAGEGVRGAALEMLRERDLL